MKNISGELKRLGYREIFPEKSAPAGYVDALEQSLSCSLPDDYRAFLREFPCAGGCLAEARVPVDQVTDEYPNGSVPWLILFGYDAGGSYDLEKVNLENLDRRIEDAIIIGDDYFSNFFHLGCTEHSPNPGVSMVISRGSGGYAKIRIANSFSDFISKTYLVESP